MSHGNLFSARGARDPRTGAGSGAIGGRAFYDLDNDGVRDALADDVNGVADVALTLHRCDAPRGEEAALATTATRADGRYTFRALGPGEYFVAAAAPAGYEISAPWVEEEEEEGGDGGEGRGRRRRLGTGGVVHTDDGEKNTFDPAAGRTVACISLAEGSQTMDRGLGFREEGSGGSERPSSAPYPMTTTATAATTATTTTTAPAPAPATPTMPPLATATPTYGPTSIPTDEPTVAPSAVPSARPSPPLSSAAPSETPSSRPVAPAEPARLVSSDNGVEPPAPDGGDGPNMAVIGGGAAALALLLLAAACFAFHRRKKPRGGPGGGGGAVPLPPSVIDVDPSTVSGLNTLPPSHIDFHPEAHQDDAISAVSEFGASTPGLMREGAAAAEEATSGASHTHTHLMRSKASSRGDDDDASSAYPASTASSAYPLSQVEQLLQKSARTLSEIREYMEASTAGSPASQRSPPTAVAAKSAHTLDEICEYMETSAAGSAASQRSQPTPAPAPAPGTPQGGQSAAIADGARPTDRGEELVCGLELRLEGANAARCYYTGQVDAASRLPHGIGTLKREGGTKLEGEWQRGLLVGTAVQAVCLPMSHLPLEACQMSHDLTAAPQAMTKDPAANAYVSPDQSSVRSDPPVSINSDPDYLPHHPVRATRSFVSLPGVKAERPRGREAPPSAASTTRGRF